MNTMKEDVTIKERYMEGLKYIYPHYMCQAITFYLIFSQDFFISLPIFSVFSLTYFHLYSTLKYIM